jgi:hypothetical protein
MLWNIFKFTYFTLQYQNNHSAEWTQTAATPINAYEAIVCKHVR